MIAAVPPGTPHPMNDSPPGEPGVHENPGARFWQFCAEMVRNGALNDGSLRRLVSIRAVASARPLVRSQGQSCHDAWYRSYNARLFFLRTPRIVRDV